MSKFVNFAVDTGASGWKVGHKSSQFYLTSLVTRGPLRDQVNGVFEPNRSNDSLDNIAINLDDGLYYVGNSAKYSQTREWSGSGKERYTQADFMEPMKHAAMSEAGLTGNNPIIVTTCVPAKWSNETVFYKGQHISAVDALAQNFQGDVVIDRVGQRGQRVVSVDSVKVLTETQALLFSFLLDKSGTVAIEDYQEMNFAVVDIGELTTCIDVFKGLEQQGDGITLTDVSMGKILKASAAQVLEQTGRDLKHWQIRDIMRDGKRVIVPAKGNRKAKSVNIEPIYKDVVGQMLPALRSEFSDYITRSDDIHYIIIGGGGSEVLGSALTDYYEQASIAGQFATLQGLRNYGEMLCNAQNS